MIKRYSKILIIFTAMLGFGCFYSFSINMTESLPHYLYFIEKHKSPKKNDYIQFEIHNHNHGHDTKYPLWVKQIKGVSGDEISILNQTVFINGKLICIAKENFLNGSKANVIVQGQIPEGYVYVYAPHKDSFDSRYQEFGLVSLDDVIGVAHPVF